MMFRNSSRFCNSTLVCLLTAAVTPRIIENRTTSIWGSGMNQELQCNLDRETRTATTARFVVPRIYSTIQYGILERQQVVWWWLHLFGGLRLAVRRRCCDAGRAIGYLEPSLAEGLSLTCAPWNAHGKGAVLKHASAQQAEKRGERTIAEDVDEAQRFPAYTSQSRH